MDILKKFSYPFGGFSQGVFAAFTNAILPLFLLSYTTNTALIGILVTAAIFGGAIAPLVIGILSDRINTPWGKRKPFLWLGTLTTVLLLLMISSLNQLALIAILIFLAGLARGITIAPHMAMLPANSTLGTRSYVSALTSIATLIGQVMITLYATLFWAPENGSSIFTVVALLFVLPNLATLLWSHDETSHAGEQSSRLNLALYFRNPRRNRYLLSQLCLWFGISMIVPFFTLFVNEYLKLPQSTAIFLYSVVVAASGVFAYPFAILGRKIGEIKAFRIGLAAFTAAAVIGIFARFLPEASLFLLAILAGSGLAASLVYSFPILTKLSSHESMGLTSGIHAAIGAGSAPLAAIISGLAISLFGYPVMFVGLAVTTVLCFLLLEEKVRLKFW